MFRVVEEPSVYVIENRLGFFEPDTVLSAIALVPWIRPARSAADIDII